MVPPPQVYKWQKSYNSGENPPRKRQYSVDLCVRCRQRFPEKENPPENPEISAENPGICSEKREYSEKSSGSRKVEPRKAENLKREQQQKSSACRKERSRQQKSRREKTQHPPNPDETVCSEIPGRKTRKQ